MHERIRVADPDLADVALAIFQFKNTEEGLRPPTPHFDDGIVPYTFHDLAEMTHDVYEMWAEELDGREEETRKRAGGLKGDLI